MNVLPSRKIVKNYDEISIGSEADDHRTHTHQKVNMEIELRSPSSWIALPTFSIRESTLQRRTVITDGVHFRVRSRKARLCDHMNATHAAASNNY